MNKKAKIAINLSVIALILAGGAQIYTNYKINQTLQQFPYAFSDKFLIHVEQVENHFFSRELVFSVENLQNPNSEKTEIISTKLTALPFAIIAKSELPAPLIRKLNKALNITIDENVINSKFSVVGDYLQSTMLTKFRDFTNVSQQLETDLNFAAKTQFVEIQTDLSGFNYDSVTKIGKLSGSYTLEPLGEHRYDLINATISLDKLNLTDGENNKFDFDKLNYQFDKSFHEDNYDLALTFNAENFRFTEKNIQVELQSALLKSRQTGVPNYLNFYEKMKNLGGKYTLKDLAFIALDYLFENQKSEWNFTAKNMLLRQGETIKTDTKNPRLSITINNENKQQAQINTNFSVDSFQYHDTPENNLVIQQFDMNNQLSQFNLSAHLSMLKKYLFNQDGKVQLDEQAFFKKDNPEFIQELTELTKEYQAKNSSTFTLKSVQRGDDFLGENLRFNYRDEALSSDQLAFNLNVSADRLQFKPEHISFDKLSVDVPIQLSPLSTIYPIYYCYGVNNLYALTCANNLDQKTVENFLSKAIADFQLSLQNATLSTEINTLPKSESTLVTAALSAAVNAIPDKKRADILAGGDKLDKTDITANVQIPASLIADMYTDNPSDSAKLKMNSPIWKAFYEILHDEESPFVLKDGIYQLKYNQKQGNIFINGQPLYPAQPN